MGLDYVWEKFFEAVLNLATNTSPLQQRLADAYRDNLIMLEVDELPDEIKGTFQSLLNVLDRVAGSGGQDGTAAMSAATLDHEEARRLIKSIVQMYDQVAKYGPNGGAFEEQ